MQRDTATQPEADPAKAVRFATFFPGCIEHDLALELADRIEALLRCDKKSADPEPENENV